MTTLAGNFTPRHFAQGWNKQSRRSDSGTFATALQAFYGSVCMSVDGVVQTVLSGAAMAAKCATYTGGDGNSGLSISARQAGVRVALTSGAAESIVFALGATTDITITYNNGTSTPNSLLNLIRGNGEANRLLRAKAIGTGAGTLLVAVLIANGAVPFIQLEGVAQRPLGTLGGGAPVALDPTEVFDVGCYGMLADTNPPKLNSTAFLIDDQTISATVDPLALTAPLRVREAGLFCVDLMEAR